MKRLPVNSFRFWLILFAAGMTVLFSVIFFYLPYVVKEVKNPVAGLFNDSLTRTRPPEFGKYGLQGQTFVYTTRDTLQMSGFYVPAETPAKGTVIALHGYRSNKNKYLPVVHYFTRAGYDFVAVDLRGHNMSQGEYTGFSYLEKNDIDDLIDYLKKQGLVHGKLVLYGHSIGAATAVAVASRRNDIDGLVLESLFTSFNKIVPNYVAYYTGVSADSIPPEAEKWIFRRMDIPADSIRPIDQVEKLRVPVLLFHGKQDKKVPPDHAREIYRRLQAPKRLIWIDSATHNTLWEKGGEAYFRHIIRFLDTLPPH